MKDHPETATTVLDANSKRTLLIDHVNWSEESAPEAVPVKLKRIPFRVPRKRIVHNVEYCPLNN